MVSGCVPGHVCTGSVLLLGGIFTSSDLLRMTIMDALELTLPLPDGLFLMARDVMQQIEAKMTWAYEAVIKVGHLLALGTCHQFCVSINVCDDVCGTQGWKLQRMWGPQTIKWPGCVCPSPRRNKVTPWI